MDITHIYRYLLISIIIAMTPIKLLFSLELVPADVIELMTNLLTEQDIIQLGRTCKKMNNIERRIKLKTAKKFMSSYLNKNYFTEQMTIMSTEQIIDFYNSAGHLFIHIINKYKDEVLSYLSIEKIPEYPEYLNPIFMAKVLGIARMKILLDLIKKNDKKNITILLGNISLNQANLYLEKIEDKSELYYHYLNIKNKNGHWVFYNHKNFNKKTASQIINKIKSILDLNQIFLNNDLFPNFHDISEDSPNMPSAQEFMHTISELYGIDRLSEYKEGIGTPLQVELKKRHINNVKSLIADAKVNINSEFIEDLFNLLAQNPNNADFKEILNLTNKFKLQQNQSH